MVPIKIKVRSNFSQAFLRLGCWDLTQDDGLGLNWTVGPGLDRLVGAETGLLSLDWPGVRRK